MFVSKSPKVVVWIWIMVELLISMEDKSNEFETLSKYELTWYDL